MNTSIEDFDKNVFAEILLVNLHKFGFGTLSKSDLETLLYYSLVQSNMKINCSTSYEKAELLMITDSKLTGLRKRSGIWLDKERDSDDKILERFLGKCIQFYLKMPYESNIKVVIDD